MAVIQFITQPTNVEVHKPVIIKWTGGDGSPVTITLKKGTASNLKTVAIIFSSFSSPISGQTFVWTPADLTEGDDYALQISQGISYNNYTGLFSISGGGSSAFVASAPASPIATFFTAASSIQPPPSSRSDEATAVTTLPSRTDSSPSETNTPQTVQSITVVSTSPDGGLPQTSKIIIGVAVPALAILLAIIGFLVFQRRKGRKARVGGEEREKASGTEVERNVENPQLPEDVSTGGRI